MATLAKLRERLPKHPEVRKEYDRLGPFMRWSGPWSKLGMRSG